MSLKAIIEKINARGQTDVEQIEAETRKQNEQILAEALTEVTQIKKEEVENAMLGASRERARIMRRARLEHLQIIGKVREGLVETALNQSRGRLEGIRTEEIYNQILRRFTQEALFELTESLEDINLASLEADLCDQKLLEKILREMKLKIDIEYHQDSLGGVIAKSDDGKLVVINTLESRLEKAIPFLRRHLAAFFEEKAHADEVYSTELETLNE